MDVLEVAGLPQVLFHEVYVALVVQLEPNGGVIGKASVRERDDERAAEKGSSRKLGFSEIKILYLENNEHLA